MKKAIYPITLIVLMVLLNGCGVNHALVLNQNQNSTQVHLTSNNFQLVDKVSGSAEVEYVLIFGGMNKRQLYQQAYSEMMDKANLSGSKALVNILTEEHLGGVPPFYFRRTITVSAQIIEFIN